MSMWMLGSVMVTLTLPGCDEDGSTDDVQDDGAAAQDGDDSAPVDPPSGDARTFAGGILPIIAASCSCHREAVPAGGLDLRDDQAYDALVGVDASAADLVLVEPGAPDDSYLLAKLRGTQVAAGGVGGSMPIGGSLAAGDIATVETWIIEGAIR
jgi:hypothetical protein